MADFRGTLLLLTPLVVALGIALEVAERRGWWPFFEGGGTCDINPLEVTLLWDSSEPDENVTEFPLENYGILRSVGCRSITFRVLEATSRETQIIFWFREEPEEEEEYGRFLGEQDLHFAVEPIELERRYYSLGMRISGMPDPTGWLKLVIIPLP